MTLFLNHELAFQLEEDLRTGNQQLIKAWKALNLAPIQAIAFDSIIAVYGGPDCPINEAVGLGMASPVDEYVLNKIEEFYDSNNHPTIVRVCPLAHPSLLENIRERGYVLTSFSYRWVLDLSLWKSPFDSPDSRIRVAKTSEEIEWARTVSAGFADTDELSTVEEIVLERAFFRVANNMPIIAIENGQIAAGGVLEIGEQVAALFATSTLPSYRKRGLQTALLDWRLRYAKEQGVRIATIETDPDSASQRNVERMGFRLAYVTSQLQKPVSNRK